MPRPCRRETFLCEKSTKCLSKSPFSQDGSTLCVHTSLLQERTFNGGEGPRIPPLRPISCVSSTAIGLSLSAAAQTYLPLRLVLFSLSLSLFPIPPSSPLFPIFSPLIPLGGPETKGTKKSERIEKSLD